ncbi:MAG: helix-turn-helix domain-containing protein [Alphaproteobacteria bacterium]|nr:helix-turn-helix domain-containing protein [Alphaproteobacteria bacterium]
MMDLEEFPIGELARRTGCKVPTIRYFEQVGLLPQPPRSSGNHRLYGAQHLALLGFIRHSRELGFSQKDIREMLDLANFPDHSCESIDAIARGHLADVDRRIDALTRLKAELERMIGECEGGKVTDCRIMESLADHPHNLCLDPHHS